MFWISSLIGKMVVWATRHLGGGHGSALPGLIVERLCPGFLSRLMKQLPDGVVLVSGTNGKTTTTKIIVDLLRADGYRVFTNPSGSNYTRGVISAALPLMRRGKLPADIAVLELDEAYATRFVDQVQPKYSLLLNVLRDQLDRFGEIDNTAKLLQYVAERTIGVVVLNEDDPRLMRLIKDVKIKAKNAWFGYSGSASKFYRTDEELHDNGKEIIKDRPLSQQTIAINSLQDDWAEYLIDGNSYQTKLRLFGIHNALNCAAAMALVRAVEGDKFTPDQVVEHLGAIKPAFGRGEIITIGDSQVRLVLVKNPSGFQLSLDSSPRDWPTMIAINDAYADGRDVSWLWDVSFADWQQMTMTVTGIRAYDMALRLNYDNIPLTTVESDITMATKQFVNKLAGQSGQIFATYTAMLKIRDELERMEKNHA